MITIVQKDNKGLRKIAEAVPVKEITSPKIQKIIADMKVALASQDDGVAIAAPQIDVPLRIFVVSGKVTTLMKGKKITEPALETSSDRDSVYINLRAVSEMDELFASIDMAKDEMVRELESNKDKKISLVRRGGVKIKNLIKGIFSK